MKEPLVRPSAALQPQKALTPKRPFVVARKDRISLTKTIITRTPDVSAHRET